MNSTIDWPKLLSNIIGAIGDSAQWNPIVADMTPGQGVLILGSVLSAGSDGKLKLTDASSYNQAFGILLETIDTGTDAAATQEFAASVARQGSFKATELVMPPGAGPEPVRGCLTQKTASTWKESRTSYLLRLVFERQPQKNSTAGRNLCCRARP